MHRSPKLVTVVIALTLAATVAACGASSAPAAGAAPRPIRGSLNLITSAEVESAGNDVVNAYDLVQRLRPGMMRARNLTAGNTGDGNVFGVIAYVDDIRLGDVEQLRTVMRATVREIRYISALDATTRWGTGHSNGVIQVLIKR